MPILNLKEDMITASAIVGPLAVMLWYFFRRWMERMDRMEEKLDAMAEFRTNILTRVITREEYNHGMTRVHERLDEHIAEGQELASRIARLEGSLPPK